MTAAQARSSSGCRRPRPPTPSDTAGLGGLGEGECSGASRVGGHRRPGIRIAGELDYQAEEPLALALAEAVRLESDLMVNMAALALWTPRAPS